MSIIKRFVEFIFGTRDQQKRVAGLLVRQLRQGHVVDWYDVDDFLHRGFLSDEVNDAGELCGYLARVYPGEISNMFSKNMFSKDALPYLKRIEDSLLRDTSNISEIIAEIMRDVVKNEHMLKNI